MARWKRVPGIQVFKQWGHVWPWLITVLVILLADCPYGRSEDSGRHYTNPIGGPITMGDPFILRDDGRHFFPS